MTYESVGGEPSPVVAGRPVCKAELMKRRESPDFFGC
jgi:hypothetical protein